MFFWALLLDMIFLGTPQLRGGVHFFVCYKVSFAKHSSAHIVLNVAFSLIFFRTGFVWEQYNDRTGEGQVVNLNQFVNFAIRLHVAKFLSTFA